MFKMQHMKPPLNINNLSLKIAQVQSCEVTGDCGETLAREGCYWKAIWVASTPCHTNRKSQKCFRISTASPAP